MLTAQCQSSWKGINRWIRKGQNSDLDCIAVEITSEFICSQSPMLKTIRPLKLPTVSCIFCELTGQTLSYLCAREVFKIQIKWRDSSKKYVRFVYDVSSVFFWQGNIVSETQEISLRLGWSLCFLFAFGHLTIFPKDEAWKMRLHVSFCIYIFSEQFFRCQEHKCKQKKRAST